MEYYSYNAQFISQSLWSVALITFTGGFEEWKNGTANTRAYIQ